MHWPIVSFQTPDKYILDGLLVEPEEKSKQAIVFVHGLGSVFYTNIPLLTTLTKLAKSQNAAFFPFNTRGATTITRFRKIDKRKKKGYRSVVIGAAFETFTDCVHDINGVLDFLESKGYTKIVLIGHSTGANKVVYYLSKKKDKRVKAAALLAPASDIVAFQLLLKDKFNETIQAAEKMVVEGKEKEFLPKKYRVDFCTAERFLSLVKEKSRENTFAYHNPRASWTALKKIAIPTLVLFGAEDKNLDQSAEKVVDIFKKKLKKNPCAKFSIIQDAGHSFTNCEDKVTKEIANFLMSS